MKKTSSDAGSRTTTTLLDETRIAAVGFQNEGQLDVEEISRRKRLVDWNVDILLRGLKKVVAQRSQCELVDGTGSKNPQELNVATSYSAPLDEVVEIISLPHYNSKCQAQESNEYQVILSDAVIKQLHSYVNAIAGM